MAMTGALSDREIAEGAAIAAANPTGSSYVEWGAIIAGAVMASAISALLLSFGSAIGLSVTSAMPSAGISATGFLLAVTIWVVWVQVSSFIAGGYLSGRMRRRTGDGEPEEVEARDGAHGLMVWAVGTFVATVMLAGAATSVVMTGTQVAGAAIGAVGAAGAGAAAVAAKDGQPTVDPIGYTVDALFRTDTPTPPTADWAASRQELVRILAMGAAQGQVSAEDKAYVARLVAARTGLPQAEADKRVTDVMARAETMAKDAEAKVRQAAEQARKAGMMLAFLAVASMLVSAAAAWWAAKLGGKHRDEGTHFGRYFRFVG